MGREAFCSSSDAESRILELTPQEWACSHVSTYYYALRIKRDIQASMRKQVEARNKK